MIGKLWVRKTDYKFRTLLSDLEEELNLGEKFAVEN